MTRERNCAVLGDPHMLAYLSYVGVVRCYICKAMKWIFVEFNPLFDNISRNIIWRIERYPWFAGLCDGPYRGIVPQTRSTRELETLATQSGVVGLVRGKQTSHFCGT